MLYDTILVFDWKNLKNSENPPENLSLGWETNVTHVKWESGIPVWHLVQHIYLYYLCVG
jgi:hypothetical protein